MIFNLNKTQKDALRIILPFVSIIFLLGGITGATIFGNLELSVLFTFIFEAILVSGAVGCIVSLIFKWRSDKDRAELKRQSDIDKKAAQDDKLVDELNQSIMEAVMDIAEICIETLSLIKLNLSKKEFDIKFDNICREYGYKSIIKFRLGGLKYKHLFVNEFSNTIEAIALSLEGYREQVKIKAREHYKINKIPLSGKSNLECQKEILERLIDINDEEEMVEFINTTRKTYDPFCKIEGEDPNIILHYYIKDSPNPRKKLAQDIADKEKESLLSSEKAINEIDCDRSKGGIYIPKY